VTAPGRIENLIRLLGVPVRREEAGRALLAMGLPTVRPLCTALGHADTRIRQAAAELLGRAGELTAVGPLCAAASDRDRNVRAAAATALGALGDQRSALPLMALLRDEYRQVREAAARALGSVGAAAACEALCIALRDESEAVRAAAVAALASLDWQPANRREAAWLAVASQRWERAVALGPAAAEPLAAAMRCSSGVARPAAEALARIGATEHLCAALRDPDWQIRDTAVRALVRVGRPAIPRLCRVLMTEGRDARRAAAEALGEIGDRSALPALRERLPYLALGGEREADVRAALRSAIARIEGITAAIQALPLPSRPADPDPRSLPVAAAGPASPVP
jgi:HEAT repeat protein